ncbi:hypothetical protein CCHR01_04901 [Colletotrichum chrysophilum]|uniref:Uncharacterized protein n=1 Tax=Colletotrichum chrysophilum TaxID=1836956 RepID=A0AAD9AQ83_9PEZI|nr:hypothetical protein CCHR01_04901 [Colletotrichum chrysophilum]
MRYGFDSLGASLGVTACSHSQTPGNRHRDAENGDDPGWAFDKPELAVKFKRVAAVQNVPHRQKFQEGLPEIPSFRDAACRPSCRAAVTSIRFAQESQKAPFGSRDGA